ncbi:MAG: hypothetical protein AB7S41_11835, partial [Parvibaculaceae bacterium]
MGLSIEISAKVPRQGLLRRLKGRADTLSDIESVCRSFVAEQQLEDIWTFERRDNSLWMELHSVEEPLHLSLEGDRLSLSARTSTAGPGYHAHVVDIIDQLGRVLGLEWTLDKAGGDDTDYYTDRDFARLQTAMADQHVGVSKMLLDISEEEDTSFLISQLSPSLGVLSHGHFAATPRGYRDKAYYLTVSGSEGSERLAFAADWYPWWTRRVDGEFWNRAGQVIAWQQVPWRPAQSEAETQSISMALRCFMRAKKLGTTSPIPTKEI